MAMPLHQLLKIMLDENASDLHITTNSPPQIRVHGNLKPLNHPPLSAPETKQLVYSILRTRRSTVSRGSGTGFFLRDQGFGKVQGQRLYQRGAVSGAFRMIPSRREASKSWGCPMW